MLLWSTLCEKYQCYGTNPKRSVLVILPFVYHQFSKIELNLSQRTLAWKKYNRIIQSDVTNVASASFYEARKNLLLWMTAHEKRFHVYRVTYRSPRFVVIKIKNIEELISLSPYGLRAAARLTARSSCLPGMSAMFLCLESFLERWKMSFLH